MASNPPIDAVPDHLRERSNPTHTIQRYLAGSRPFLHEFTKRGREHIDRALERDEKRARVDRERKEREQEGLSIGSTSWEGTGSTVTGLTGGSSRSAGVVKRMRRKDGTCPGESLGQVSDKNKVDKEQEREVVVVLKRTEVEPRKPTRRPSPVDKTHSSKEDKENRHLDIHLSVAKDQAKIKINPIKTIKPPNEMQIDLPGPSARRALADQHENELERNIIKKGLEEVDLESMTSSARRRFERKIRRRIKSAIRHTPSKPPDLGGSRQSDEEEAEEAGNIIHVLPRPPTTLDPIPNSTPGPANTTKSKSAPTSTLPPINDLPGPIRKRKGNVGIALMTNFTSVSMAKGKRMTLVHRERQERGFLGGLKVSSGRSGTGLGMNRQGLARAPSSSPPSKFRRVDTVLKIQGRERKERSGSISGSVRRSARLSRTEPGPVAGNGEKEEEPRSRSDPESRSSTSRRMAANLATIPEAPRLMDEPEPEPELEWSLSSPGRGRAAPQEPGTSESPSRATRSDKSLGHWNENEHGNGRNRTPSFHVRTDTPVSRPSQLRTQREVRARPSPLRPIRDDQTGTRRAFGALVQVESDIKTRQTAKKGEKNWFKPPKARGGKRKYPGAALVEYEDSWAVVGGPGEEEYGEEDGMGFRFDSARQGGVEQIGRWMEEDEKENLGVYGGDGTMMGVQMEGHGMDLDYAGYQLGDLDLDLDLDPDQLHPERESMEGYVMPLDIYSGGPYASYETDQDHAAQRYPNTNDGVIQQHLDGDLAYELVHVSHPMELDVDGVGFGVHHEPEQMMDEEESDPAIDMFGTRVSELERQIFVGGRGRW